ncbi:hypothetical protein Tco_1473288 [Tanacetum coccineum]
MMPLNMKSRRTKIQIQENTHKGVLEKVGDSEVPRDSDPFELASLINKKCGKITYPKCSATPDFPSGYSPKSLRDQQVSESFHKLSDGDSHKQSGFSLIQRLEEIIKVDMALGLNMEGCENTLASLRADNEEYIVWGNTHFDFASTSARGKSGGIMSLWNSLVFQKSNILYIPLGGFNFTWTDKWGTKMSKLDWFMISESFYEVFPHTTGVVLEKGILDHRPILLKESNTDYSPTPFRFFHSWLEMDGFHDLVTDSN